jgi:hypothetical protein
MAVGYRVDTVWLDRGIVRFVRAGAPVTTRRPAIDAPARSGPRPAVEPPPVRSGPRPAVGGVTDVRARMQWRAAGPVILDAGGRPSFPPVEGVPGLYRMRFSNRSGAYRPAIYIGQTDNLRRRLNGYRSPATSQQTNVRINTRLRQHLGAGEAVELDVVTEAFVDVGGRDGPLDLTTGSARLLAVGAALVAATLAGDAEIVNLG